MFQVQLFVEQITSLNEEFGKQTMNYTNSKYSYPKYELLWIMD